VIGKKREKFTSKIKPVAVWCARQRRREKLEETKRKQSVEV
jgi:hypothetical protein